MSLLGPLGSRLIIFIIVVILVLDIFIIVLSFFVIINIEFSFLVVISD